MEISDRTSTDVQLAREIKTPLKSDC